MESSTEPKRNIESVWCWLALAGLMVNQFISEGFLRSYGLIYLELLDLYSAGAQATGVLATILSVTGLITGPIGGVLGDRFSPAWVLIGGTLLMTGGAILCAFSLSLFHVIVGYCFVGTGRAVIFTITLGAMSKIFIYNRALASGLMAAGGSVGGMVVPLMIPPVAEELTVRGVFTVFGGLMLEMLVSGFLLRLVYLDYRKSTLCDKQEALKNESRSTEDTASTEHPSLGANVASVTASANNSNPTESSQRNVYQKIVTYLKKYKEMFNLKLLGAYLYVMFVISSDILYPMYVPPYAEEQGLTKTQIAQLLTVFGATGLVSRLLTGFLGNLSRVNIYFLVTASCAISGVFTLILPLLISLTDATLPLLMSSMVVTGLLIGGQLALLSPILVNAVGPEFVSTAFGLNNIPFNIGMAIPPLIFGALKESTGVYTSVPMVCGAATLLSGLFIQVGQRPPWKMFGKKQMFHVN